MDSKAHPLIEYAHILLSFFFFDRNPLCVLPPSTSNT